MLRLWLVFLFTVQIVSADTYSLRAAWGMASKNDFGQILSGQSEVDDTGASVVGMDAGWLWKKDFYDLPFDVYLKGGMYRFLEKGSYFANGQTYVQKNDFYEAVLYIKGYWNFDFLDNRVRLGVAEGISYAWGIPIVERIEADENDDYNSNALNYLEVSFDVDFGRLIQVEALHETYLGYTLKHRSGVYGMINSVSRGGSNYNMVTVEKNF